VTSLKFIYNQGLLFPIFTFTHDKTGLFPDFSSFFIGQFWQS
jgi:hypothetical protein